MIHPTRSLFSKMCLLFSAVVIAAWTPTAAEPDQPTPTKSSEAEASVTKDQHSDNVANLSFVMPNGERVLRLEVAIDTDLATVWENFTTESGVSTWMVGKARIDLRTGGTMRTQYDMSRSLDDTSAIVLGIPAFLPRELLIYKIHLNGVFPEKCRQEDQNLQEILQFRADGKNRTIVTSSMVGWGTGPEWDKAYSFFERGNIWTYGQLVERFTTGPVKWE
ncbi:MAG: SRPBCC domain-containing protein [Candidatus Zixiibacteriota bacterium]